MKWYIWNKAQNSLKLGILREFDPQNNIRKQKEIIVFHILIYTIINSSPYLHNNKLYVLKYNYVSKRIYQNTEITAGLREHITAQCIIIP